MNKSSKVVINRGIILGGHMFGTLMSSVGFAILAEQTLKEPSKIKRAVKTGAVAGVGFAAFVASTLAMELHCNRFVQSIYDAFQENLAECIRAEEAMEKEIAGDDEDKDGDDDEEDDQAPPTIRFPDNMPITEVLEAHFSTKGDKARVK